MELLYVYCVLGVIALIGIIYNHYALKRDQQEAGMAK